MNIQLIVSSCINRHTSLAVAVEFGGALGCIGTLAKWEEPHELRTNSLSIPARHSKGLQVGLCKDPLGRTR